MIPLGTFESTGAHFKVVAYLKEYRHRKSAANDYDDDDSEDDDTDDDFDAEDILENYLARRQLSAFRIDSDVASSSALDKREQRGTAEGRGRERAGTPKREREVGEEGEARGEEEEEEENSWSSLSRERRNNGTRSKADKTVDKSKIKSNVTKVTSSEGCVQSTSSLWGETTNLSSSATWTTSIPTRIGADSSSRQDVTSVGLETETTRGGIREPRGAEGGREVDDEREEEEEEVVWATPPGRKKQRFSFRDSRNSTRE